MPQEDLGSAIGGSRGGSAIGGAQVDLPGALLDTAPPPVPPDIPTPDPTPPGQSVPMFRVVSHAAGSEDVTEGATVVTVNGTFVPPYAATVVPSWATERWVLSADKLTTSFTVRFTQVAPANSTIDWAVGGA